MTVAKMTYYAVKAEKTTQRLKRSADSTGHDKSVRLRKFPNVHESAAESDRGDCQLIVKMLLNSGMQR